MAKAILAVVLGYAAWTLMWLGGGQVVQKALPNAVGSDGSVSDPKALGALLALSVVCSAVSGLLAGRLARKSKAPLILALALLATGGAVQYGYWDKMPLWYHISFLAAILPVVLIGAMIGRKAKPEIKKA